VKGGNALKKYSILLYDDIGNAYERKNKYIEDIAKLYEEYDETKDKAILSKISQLHKDKDQHPYIIKLNKFDKEEKEFLSQLKIKIKKYNKNLNQKSYKMKKLMIQLFISKEKNNFYKAYEELSYETSYQYQKSLIELNQLPLIIEHLEVNEQKINESIKNKKNISNNSEDNLKAKADYTAFSNEQNKELKEGISKLKEKRRKHQISKKALEDGIKELKLQHKKALKVKHYDLPVKKNNELIKNLKFEINKTTKRKENVLKANIADLRRKTPVETMRAKPINAFISFLLPGLGQLLNKQCIKGILFLLASCFVYGIAIPYALGFGNYQGEGITGLISLAADGRKIDKSLIFMIEGIIAIFLIIFASIILILSFIDVYKVEKDKIKGIRQRNWFETKTNISEDGFPYLVSMPALVVIVFIVIVPIATTILLSFTGMDPNNQSKFSWIGIKNYKLIALGEGMAGSSFWLILGWTLIWTLFATTLAIAIGFLFAILVNNDRVKGKTFFRSVYLLPWAVPSFITVMFFSIMFSSNGALTEIITNIVGTKIEIKNDPILSRITLILIQGWLGSSYIFLLSTGVLQGIPGDLYEAAQIDGATAWQKLRRITLPIVLFQTAPLLVGQYTFNFNNFTTIYLFNSGGPFNPSKYGNLAGSTDLLISYIFKLTIENQYQSVGAAITIVISLGLMLFAFIGFKNSKAFGEEKL
jgi:arabinogalactan oligomer/maltooligosaccharide transport system permease protein